MEGLIGLVPGLIGLIGVVGLHVQHRFTCVCVLRVAEAVVDRQPVHHPSHRERPEEQRPISYRRCSGFNRCLSYVT
jgi:hypothetical protein